MPAPPPTRRSQRLALALADLGQDELASQRRLAPMTPDSNLFNPRNPPQRPFVTDLRLSPAQRSRSSYSPHWLDQVEAPGCGLVPEEEFLTITGYKFDRTLSPPRSPSPPRSRDGTYGQTPKSNSKSIAEEGMRKAIYATKAVKDAQRKSRIFEEGIALPKRSSHDFRVNTPQFDRSVSEPPKMRYLERLNKYHAFDGRLINSKVINKT